MFQSFKTSQYKRGHYDDLAIIQERLNQVTFPDWKFLWTWTDG